MLTTRDFANLVIRNLRERGEARTIVFDAPSFSLHIAPEGDEKRTLFLSNVYGEYVSADTDAARETLLANVVSSASRIDGEEQLGEVLIHLMPRLRPRAYFEAGVRLAMKDAGADASKARAGVPHEVLARDLGISVAIDREDSIEEITDFSKYDCDFARAMEAARINLARRSAEPFIELAPGTYASPWGDHYDAERMLLLDRVRELAVDGDPVALIPSRHRLFITGEDDPSGLERIVSEAETVLAGPRPLTALAFVLRGDGWHPFVPEGDSRAEKRLRELREAETAAAYAEQKAWLEACEEPAFVASVMLGDTGSLGVLTAGVPTLLPRTRHVSLNDMDSGAFETVDFSAFERVLGEAAKPRDDLYPPRVFVEAFPTAQQVAEMKSRTRGALPSSPIASNAEAPAAPKPVAMPFGGPAPDVSAFGGGAPASFGAPPSHSRGRVLGVFGVIGIVLLVLRLGLLLSKPSRHYDYKPIYVPPPIPTTAKVRPRLPLRGAAKRQVLSDTGSPTSVAASPSHVFWIDGESSQLFGKALPSAAARLRTQRGLDDDDDLLMSPPGAGAAVALSRLDAPVLKRHRVTAVATSTYVYTLRASSAGAAVMRTPSSGGAATPIATLEGEPLTLTLGRDAVYVAVDKSATSPAHVLRVPLFGGTSKRVATVAAPCALVVHPWHGQERLYVVDSGRGVRGYPLGTRAAASPRLEPTAGTIVPDSARASCSIASGALRIYWTLPAAKQIGGYSPGLARTTLAGGYQATPVAVASRGAFVYVVSEDAFGARGGMLTRQIGTSTPRVLTSDEGFDGLAATSTGVVWTRGTTENSDGEVAMYGPSY